VPPSSPKKITPPIHFQTVCSAVAALFLFLGLSAIHFSSVPRAHETLSTASFQTGGSDLDRLLHLQQLATRVRGGDFGRAAAAGFRLNQSGNRGTVRGANRIIALRRLDLSGRREQSS
jgi:hypothetical protein